MTIITQRYSCMTIIGEDANGKIIGRPRSTGIGRRNSGARALTAKRTPWGRARCAESPIRLGMGSG